jgi:hypothetical protein
MFVLPVLNKFRGAQKKIDGSAVQPGRKNFGTIDEYQKSWKIMITCLTVVFFPLNFPSSGRKGLNDFYKEVFKVVKERFLNVMTRLFFVLLSSGSE